MFRFADPTYLYLLIILPFIAAFYIYSNFKRRKAIKKFGDPELMAQLMPDVSRYRPDVKFWLVFAALALTIVLMARPQFGTKAEKVERKGVEVIIALDISNSMLAEDIVPSRLQKAKMIVSKLVDEFDQNKVGLIVFAGDAFTQLPITSDFVSAKMFLESTTPALINRQGTAIGAAVDLAARSFTPQKGVGKAIVLITDGENHEPGAVEAVKEAKKKGIVVHVLGVGSTQGSPIPVPGSSNFKKDRQGNVIITKLNEEMCKELSAAGKGIYARVDNTNSAQKSLISAIDDMAKSDMESSVYSDYDEQFQGVAWLILLLLIADLMLLERKNPLFKNIKLFKI
ncbi:vWA domain-containing protein [Bacteroides sedimenti]|uniref:Membrane protein n=1 Tax=Bacteroides sedimenti TaxID=2136147 RepID=A0ABM8I9A4_9BACE